MSTTEIPPFGIADSEAPPNPSVALDALLPRYDAAMVLILIGMALDIAGSVLQLWMLHKFHALIDIYGYGHVPRSEVPPGALIDMMTRLARLAGIVTVVTAFCLGIARAHRVAKEAGLTGFERSIGWTIGSLFIPIVSFYRPWVGFTEIRKAIFNSVDSRQLGDAWRQAESGSPATLLLQTVTIAANLIFYVYALVGRMPVGHGEAAYLAWVAHMTINMWVTIAGVVVRFGCLFVYLATLRIPMGKLVRLAENRQGYMLISAAR